MIYIGTSGYNYDHWRKVFYPESLIQNKWLEFYVKSFRTVELNVTFYRLPQAVAFKSLYNRSPKNFLFAIKGSRFITHIKRLRDVEKSVKLFFQRAKLLKEKFGVILWQLPPQFKFKAQNSKLKVTAQNLKVNNLKRFTDFLKLVSKYKIRQAFEFRDESWFCGEVYDLLKKYNFALVIADSPRYPLVEKITADFVYIRFHGSKLLFSSNYTAQELKNWAKKIKKWHGQGKDVYCYFNNDAQGFAIKNARLLDYLLMN